MKGLNRVVRRMGTGRGTALLWVVISAAGCCSSPAVVSAAASSGNKVKLVYTDPCTKEQGILDCRISDSGDVQECRRLKLIFRD